ncbi:hypothetical protein J3D61_001445 [Bacillus cereus]|nr:hypothetical protein [Bacillus cereus]
MMTRGVKLNASKLEEMTIESMGQQPVVVTKFL